MTVATIGKPWQSVIAGVRTSEKIDMPRLYHDPSARPVTLKGVGRLSDPVFSHPVACWIHGQARLRWALPSFLSTSAVVLTFPQAPAICGRYWQATPTSADIASRRKRLWPPTWAAQRGKSAIWCGSWIEPICWFTPRRGLAVPTPCSAFIASDSQREAPLLWDSSMGTFHGIVRRKSISGQTGNLFPLRVENS